MTGSFSFSFISFVMRQRMASFENRIHPDHPETENVVNLPSTNTDTVRVSVECVDDPYGQHGEVIYSNFSYRLLLNPDDGFTEEEYFMAPFDNRIHPDHPETENVVNLPSTNTDSVKVSVECVDDPYGQHGEVIYSNFSYRLLLNPDDGFTEEEYFMASFDNRIHPDHPETENVVNLPSTNTDSVKVSVECVDDPYGQHGEVIYSNFSYRLLLNPDDGLTEEPQEEYFMVSVQCEDNPEGQHGQVVCECMSYSLFPSPPALMIWTTITALCIILKMTIMM